MKMPRMIAETLIAPCGVNCLACSAHLSLKEPCPGCRAPQALITRRSCRSCAKKRCAFERGYMWCFECGQFPCARIKSLSRRYRENYGVDLIQNGYKARKDRQAFLLAQKERFTCLACGGVMDQHHGRCSECGLEGERD